VGLRPAQVHPQEHLGPVLGLGAAGTRVDVEEGVARVHLAGEHPLELQLVHLLPEAAHVGLDLGEGALVAFLGGKLEELAALGESPGQLVEDVDDVLQLGPLPAELLGPLGLLPDVRVLELAPDLLETFLLARVVKGTPSGHRPCR